MPTMIRPKLSFEANNATATPQNARSLSGSSLLGRIDRLVKRTEDSLPGHNSERAPGAPGCRERGGKRTLCTRPTIEGARWGARGSRSVNKKRGSLEPRKIVGADNGARTRDPNLGKVVLYQLSHVRICKTKRVPERPDVAWRRSPDSNRG